MYELLEEMREKRKNSFLSPPTASSKSVYKNEIYTTPI
jgi:hypothetical protein